MSDPAGFLLDLALASVPGILWFWYIHSKDIYEPEPFRLVLLAGGLGAGIVMILKWVLPYLPDTGGTADIASLLRTSLMISLTEEIPKGLVLVAVFYRHEEFDEPVDGMIYGASIGIGFSTLENAFYMSEHGRAILIFRMLISTTLHATSTGMFGYALGQFKFGHRGRMFLGCAIVAVFALHLFFDGVAALGELRPDLAWIAPVSLVGLLVLVVALHHGLDRGTEDALSRSPFRPEE